MKLVMSGGFRYDFKVEEEITENEIGKINEYKENLEKEINTAKEELKKELDFEMGAEGVLSDFHIKCEVTDKMVF